MLSNIWTYVLYWAIIESGFCWTSARLGICVAVMILVSYYIMGVEWTCNCIGISSGYDMILSFFLQNWIFRLPKLVLNQPHVIFRNQQWDSTNEKSQYVCSGNVGEAPKLPRCNQETYWYIDTYCRSLDLVVPYFLFSVKTNFGMSKHDQSLKDVWFDAQRS